MSGSCRREPARATVSLSVEHRLDIASDHPGWRCTEQPHMPKYYPTLQRGRSEEHTSELQSLMRISYAVFCLKKKKKTTNNINKCTSTKATSNENHNTHDSLIEHNNDI